LGTELTFQLLGVLEYCSGWDNIGQNDLYSLIVLWIIPK
jgi:hypothetical protein